MPRAHRPLAAVIAVLVVAGGLAAEGHRGRVRESTNASASDLAGGRGFDLLPSSVQATDGVTATPRAATSVVAPVPSPVEAEEARLQSFSTCQSFLDHVQGEALSRVTANGLPVASHTAVAVGETAVADSGGAAASSGPSPEFSTTNVQEAGVDEPDIVKNDGRRVFTIFDGSLRSHTISDEGIEVASTIDVPDGSDAELLLVGERLIMLQNAWRDSTGVRFVRLQVFDVGDPAAVTLLRELEIEGFYVSSRTAGGVVRIVVTTSPDFPFVYPQDGTEEEEARALAFNRDLLANSVETDWMPQIAVPQADASVPAVACAAMRAPAAFSGFSTTTVLTVDPLTATFGEGASVLSDAHEVYASTDNLYVATAAWPAVVDEGSWVPPQETQIHQFDITEPARAVYVASGVVPGHLIRPFLWGGGTGLGQWALSEYDGHLRVANTVGEPGADAAVSSVMVLRREGRVLLPVGSVGGLGAGERIYAVRFMEARGYVVTYKQVDPLYVIDLTDPTAPALLGELKVPGFSAYLHPVGEGRLLGIGQEDADEDGLVEGLQVSLFDVTDPARPKQLDRLRLGDRGTSSDVEHDHRAFTWWPDPARAVLPVTSWEHGGGPAAVAITIRDGALEQVGAVTHTPEPEDDEGDEECPFFVRRSRVIGDVVYTFSAGGVWGNDLEDFEPASVLRYSDARSTCYSMPEQEPEPPPSTTTTTTTTTRPFPLP